MITQKTEVVDGVTWKIAAAGTNLFDIITGQKNEFLLLAGTRY
jgi:hypothetical protein